MKHTTPHCKTLVAAIALAMAGPSLAASSVVISQIYGGGGNNGATYRNDFIELLNTSNQPVELNNWSVQYASATGGSWQVTPLSGTLAAGQYLLIWQATGQGGSQALPTPDFSGNIAMSASAGKVALVRNQTALACGSNCAGAAEVADFVGFGSANASEDKPAPAPSNTQSISRKLNGCQDSQSNSSDFAVGSVNPRNSASQSVTCSNNPTDPSKPTDPSEPSQPPSAIRIHDIQGQRHLSSLNGQSVSRIPGVVTQVTAGGFFMQDTLPDNNPLTSEGIYVFTKTAPTVAIGDAVEVSGKVKEYRPGGVDSAQLTVTELESSMAQIKITAQKQALPAPIEITGKIPARYWQGAAGDVETSPQLDLKNALDFLESLEGMRVSVTGAQVVGPTQSYAAHDTAIVANYRQQTTLPNQRGGITITEDERNSGRLILVSGNAVVPEANVGDSFQYAVGVLDYNFANFRLIASDLAPLSRGNLQAEITRAAAADELTLASFNVENLDPKDDPAKINRLASQIVTNLRSPDVVGLMEVQDGNGATDTELVSAAATMEVLLNAIRQAGGPNYSYRQIDPARNQDGGEPGGNIRQVLMFNPARVSFIDRSGATANTAVNSVACAEIACLTHSPGRIQPASSAFNNSRKPLVGEFMFNGHKLFVIANHFNSKGGDQPVAGRFQPPTLSSEVQRNQQAQIVADFVRDLKILNPNAKIAVMGDLNDYQFSAPLAKLKAAGMVDMVEQLPESERYSYVFEGNSQVLDHILLSENLARFAEYDVVHTNAEFADQVSDHDPEVARIRLPQSIQDVTAQFSLSKSGLVLDLKTKQYRSQVITRAVTAAAGNYRLVVKGLPAGVSLANATATSANGPYISFTAGNTVQLQFSNPSKQAFGYELAVEQAVFNY
ncbi:lamin tail domain-containing protein [Chitinibacter sp. ZOR0017]|uniref:lamin tail domain-containing protein n=1 Tax=Chitinibacter sp. ZOR0017 TaxID=1339254 RepID=UPI0009DDE0E0|nr:lamin tail domain-containing protein [Chitinibacter sp. ZOR0017]